MYIINYPPTVLHIAAPRGTASSPFGQSTGNTARVELTGNVLDLAERGREPVGKNMGKKHGKT